MIYNEDGERVDVNVAAYLYSDAALMITIMLDGDHNIRTMIDENAHGYVHVRPQFFNGEQWFSVTREHGNILLRYNAIRNIE